MADKNGEFRCKAKECKRLLATGYIDTGSITIKCKCGFLNTIEVKKQQKEETQTFAIRIIPEHQ